MSGPASGKAQYKNRGSDFDAPIFIEEKIIQQKTDPVDHLKAYIKNGKNDKKDDMPQRPPNSGGRIGNNGLHIQNDKQFESKQHPFSFG
jgi:hypothetical protein